MIHPHQVPDAVSAHPPRKMIEPDPGVVRGLMGSMAQVTYLRSDDNQKRGTGRVYADLHQSTEPRAPLLATLAIFAAGVLVGAAGVIGGAIVYRWFA